MIWPLAKQGKETCSAVQRARAAHKGKAEARILDKLHLPPSCSDSHTFLFFENMKMVVMMMTCTEAMPLPEGSPAAFEEKPHWPGWSVCFQRTQAPQQNYIVMIK